MASHQLAGTEGTQHRSIGRAPVDGPATTIAERAALDATEPGFERGEWALTHALDLRAMMSVTGTLLALAALHAVDTILTGHVATRDAIRRAGEQRYRRIVDTAQEGIWSIDEAGETNFVNQRMASMLGYGPEEMIGQHLLDFSR